MSKFSHRFRPRGQNFGLSLGLGLEGLVWSSLTSLTGDRKADRRTDGWTHGHSIHRAVKINTSYLKINTSYYQSLILGLTTAV